VQTKGSSELADSGRGGDSDEVVSEGCSSEDDQRWRGDMMTVKSDGGSTSSRERRRARDSSRGRGKGMGCSKGCSSPFIGAKGVPGRWQRAVTDGG
jgi:hypothetical protein